MRLALFNANGLSGKSDIIAQQLKTHNIDIINIVETLDRVERALMRPKLLVCREMTQEREIGGRKANGGISIVAPDLQNAAFQTHTLDPEGNFIIYVLEETVIAVGYFPPSEWATEKLFQFLDLAEEYAREKPLVIMGDFNARMGAYNGDHAVTPRRGQRLKEWIEQSTLRLEVPESGKYTSFGGASRLGRGIPDVILSRDCPITSFSVLEDDTWGGSDHRPLIFEIPDKVMDTAREFQRWDIRKFIDREIRNKYRASLENGETTVRESLQLATDANQAWQAVKNWIEDAARISCGRLKFRKTFGLNKDFLTPELEEQLENLENQEEAIGNQRREMLGNTRRDPTNEFKEAFSRNRQTLKATHDNLKVALEARRRQVYQQSVDKLGDPQVAAAFMRMVKNTRARKTKGACQLDPAKLETHARHFIQTFGGEPQIIEPTLDGTPIYEEGPPLNINQRRLAEMMNNFALGKAGGTDGLTGEMLSYGGPAMTRILAALFTKIAGWPDIPDDWKIALIVPIWKQKGDPKLMANYRPIALTCVTRRLYEKIIIEDLEAAAQRLSNFQGGFRNARSTLDQAYTLNEIMESNKGLHLIFLDLRAAYDLVDRRILWKKMQTQFGVPQIVIYRLCALFDHNQSIVTVGNKRATPIDNKLGLLQGSSASPLLFNFYINDLVTNLRQQALVQTSGTAANALLFADDTVIFGKTLADLSALLDTVVNWAHMNRMKFAPEKSHYIGPSEDPRLLMYGQPLSKQTNAKYLGIHFCETGINWLKSNNERVAKARSVAAMLNTIGMNATGWAPESSVRVYKTFIRPVMEYGLALYPICSAVSEPAQRAQNMAMRLLFSAPKSTAREAMATLCNLEPMSERHQLIQAKFMKRLYNSTDQTRPAVTLTRNKKQVVRKRITKADPSQHFSTLGEVIHRNTYWQDAAKINHLLAPLARPQLQGHWGFKRPREEDGDEDAAIARPPPPLRHPSEATETHRWLLKKQACLDTRSTKIGKAIGPPRKKHGIHFLMLNKCPRPTRMTLKKWRLGEICNHQVCPNCEEGAALSRQHGILCSGAMTLITRECPELRIPIALLNPTENALDLLLNKAERLGSQTLLDVAVRAIELVLIHCKKLERATNGFWRPKDPDEQQAARWTQRVVIEPQENREPQAQRPHARRAGRPSGPARRRPYDRPEP